MQNLGIIMIGHQHVVISIHIPKTGGTTFAEVLKKIYGNTLWLDYGHCYTITDFGSPTLPMQFFRLSRRLNTWLNRPKLRRIRCIHGHFSMSRHLSRFPNHSTITWLRHPVQRVISAYTELSSVPHKTKRNTLAQLVQTRGLTLEEFAHLEGARNIMSKFLRGVDIEDLAFIGIQEYYDLCLKNFFKIIGVNPFEVRKFNVRSSDTRNIDKSVFNEILSLNELDATLYQKCLRLAKDRGYISMSDE